MTDLPIRGRAISSHRSMQARNTGSLSKSSFPIPRCWAPWPAYMKTIVMVPPSVCVRFASSDFSSHVHAGLLLQLRPHPVGEQRHEFGHVVRAHVPLVIISDEVLFTRGPLVDA